MSTIFVLLWLATTVAFIVAMIKPQKMVFWTAKKTRGMGCIYLAASVLFLILGVATSSQPSSVASTNVSVVSTPASSVQSVLESESSDTTSIQSSKKPTSSSDMSSVQSSDESSKTEPAKPSSAAVVSSSAASKVTSAVATSSKTAVTASSKAASYTPKVVDAAGTVRNGQNASLTVKGKPNTKYSIEVYYSTGASTAKGLEPAVSDASGNVSWTWKVGAKTAAGTHKIIITDGKDKIETQITTTK